MSESIAELLKTHGFSEYEAKAYTAVVGLGRGTAREICEISGVPQGRIYAVLHSLAAREFVEVEAGSPTFYLAEDPAELFTALKEEYCESIDVLVGELKKLHAEAHPPSPIWSIRNERGIRHRLRMLIRNAGEDIVVIARDPGTLQSIADDLKVANRRVDLTILVTDRAPFAGIGLRVFPMNNALLDLFKEMLEEKPGMKDPTWNTELFMIVDGTSAITVGRRAGARSATVIGMPAICFTIRRLIELLEPAVRDEEEQTVRENQTRL
jgi:sugar-specific transcriptional regulator TrmB